MKLFIHFPSRKCIPACIRLQDDGRNTHSYWKWTLQFPPSNLNVFGRWKAGNPQGEAHKLNNNHVSLSAVSLCLANGRHSALRTEAVSPEYISIFWILYWTPSTYVQNLRIKHSSLRRPGWNIILIGIFSWVYNPLANSYRSCFRYIWMLSESSSQTLLFHPLSKPLILL